MTDRPMTANADSPSGDGERRQVAATPEEERLIAEWDDTLPIARRRRWADGPINRSEEGWRVLHDQVLDLIRRAQAAQREASARVVEELACPGCREDRSYLRHAIRAGVRVRWTRETPMTAGLRSALCYSAESANPTLISVEQVTPSDDEVCASLLPDERITFDYNGRTYEFYTFEYDGNLWAGPWIIRSRYGNRYVAFTNIRRVQP